MFDLIKTDFYRIFKSKTFFVILGIAVGLPILTALMVFGINKGFNLLIGEGGEDFAAINGKLLISGIYGLSSNVGIILPIFLVIFVSGDVSNGLLRNKILVGKSRTQIYFSHLFVITIISLAFISISALILSLLTFWLIPYGNNIDTLEVWSIIFYYILGTLAFIFIASLVVMMTLNFNHIVFPIIIVVLFGIGITLLSQILGLVINSLEMFTKIPEVLLPIVKNIPYLIPCYSGISFSSGFGIDMGDFENPTSFSSQMRDLILHFSLGAVSLVVFSFLATLGGLISFKKKEIK